MLQRSSIFGGLTEAQIEKMLTLTTERRFDEDAVIFRRGDLNAEMYIIASGEVKILKNGYLIAKLGEGDCFGKKAIIDIQPRSIDAVALSQTTVHVLNSKGLYILSHQHKKIFSLLIMNIAREFCRRLRRAEEFMALHATKK